MVRPYGVKVNKRRKKQEKYDREEDEEQREEKVAEKPKKKAKIENTTTKDAIDKERAEEDEPTTACELEGIPIAPSDQRTEKPGVVFVLENAALEIAKVGKTFQLLESNEHSNFLRKNKKNPEDYRPDILHQALLMILDSPINKAGRLKAVYVRTQKGVLFEVKTNTRIPRTYNRFAGLILQLLQKLRVTAADSGKSLMRVIKNPVTQYLPVDSRKLGLSYSSEKLVNTQKHLATVGNDKNFVFVVGAMAHGKIEPDYVEEFLSISGYPLSAAYCISRICEALSTNWKIL